MAVDDRLARLSAVQPGNPKRRTRSASTERWYSYYAGYADSFVREIVEALPTDTGLVLDPWNGAGTTTSVATDQRLSSVGIDLNPAAVVIARARLLRSDVRFSAEAMSEVVVASAKRDTEPCPDDDPLRSWFDEQTAARLRAIERSIYRLVVSTDDERRLVEEEALGRVDALASLFYLALFRTVRPLLAPFIGSNPTWIKRRVERSQLLHVGSEQIEQSFAEAIRSLLDAVADAAQTVESAKRTKVQVGSSQAIGLDDGSVDAIITSPPYCTRIDYVIATLPELAVLGIRPHEVDELRMAMIGTPLTAKAPSDVPAGSEQLDRFLGEVAAHRTRAAKTYYSRFFRAYFDGMRRSFAELDRVTKPGSPLVLVVQDSYFKQVRVPVAEILGEFGEQLGWTKLPEHRYPVSTNRAGMHKHARRYRTTTRATESVLIFRAG